MRKYLLLFFFCSAFALLRGQESVKPLTEEQISVLRTLSGENFEESLPATEFALHADSLLRDYKKQWFDEMSDGYGSQLFDEYALDTFWIRRFPRVLYEAGLDGNTFLLIQVNVAFRALAESTVEKYYRKLLEATDEELRPVVEESHRQWKQSMERDYNLARGLYSRLRGTMMSYIWSTDVDRQLTDRIDFYFQCYLTALLVREEALYWDESE